MSASPRRSGDRAVPASAPFGAGYRWWMLALNSLLYFSFNVVATSSAALAVPIAAELRLDAAQMGAVFGVWQLVYVGFAFGAGVVLDRFGMRRAMAAGIVVIGLSALLRSLAADFPALLASVALFGVGGPLITVGQSKVISEWFPAAQRGVAASISYGALTLGGVAVLATANGLLVPLTGGWRGALAVCAGLAFAAAGAWLVLARDAPRARHDPSSPARAAPVLDTARALLRLPSLRLLLLLATTFAVVSHGTSNWTPTILVSRSLSVADAGTWTALTTAVGIAGSLVVPRLRAAGARRHVLALFGSLTAGAILALALGSGPAMIAGLAVFSFCRSGIFPLMVLLLIETPGLGPARIGAATGLYVTFAEIGGFGGPFVVGLLRGTTGDFLVPLGLLAALAAAVAALALRVREPESGGSVSRHPEAR